MENRVLAHQFAIVLNRDQVLSTAERQNKHYGTVCTLTRITANFCPITGQFDADGNDDQIEGC